MSPMKRGKRRGATKGGRPCLRLPRLARDDGLSLNRAELNRLARVDIEQYLRRYVRDFVVLFVYDYRNRVKAKRVLFVTRVRFGRTRNAYYAARVGRIFNRSSAVCGRRITLDESYVRYFTASKRFVIFYESSHKFLHRRRTFYRNFARKSGFGNGIF